MLTVYLIGMVVLAWLAVLSGAYIVYPWYRAVPPAGVTDLSDYPRRLLLSSGRTSEWHNIGMEWKEHVAWLAPIAMTMVAYVTLRYRRAVTRSRGNAGRSAGLRCGGVRGDRNRRRLRGLPEQIRAGARRFGDRPDEGRAMSTAQPRRGDDTDVERVAERGGRGRHSRRRYRLRRHSACWRSPATRRTAFGRVLNIYNPTGTLSGVTTGAIIVWLVAWLALNRLWRTRTHRHGQDQCRSVRSAGGGLPADLPARHGPAARQVAAAYCPAGSFAFR